MGPGEGSGTWLEWVERVFAGFGSERHGPGPLLSASDPAPASVSQAERLVVSGAAEHGPRAR